MKEELSAGGVIMRAADDGPEVALISIRGGKRWGLPKGRREKGEEIETTALREVAEETGLAARVITGLGSVSYYYTFHYDGRADKRHKIVHFFLMEATGGDIRRFDRNEIADCRWFAVDRALKVLAFDDEKDLVRRAAAKFAPAEDKK